MPCFRSYLLLIGLAAAGFVASAPASAQQQAAPNPAAPAQRLQPPRFDAQRPAARPRSDSSLSDSVRWVQRTTGGQVLGAERVQSDGREINRIKYRDDQGSVRYMDDDRRPRQLPRGVDRRNETPSLPRRDNPSKP